jgi:hypothetical protein
VRQTAPRAQENIACSRRLPDRIARPLSFTVRSRLETFSFTPWITSRARRLRIYRLLNNSLCVWFLLALTGGAMVWLFPHSQHFLGLVSFPFSVAMTVLVIPSIFIAWGFSLGLIRCPSCDVRFATRLSPWVQRTCQNCGFDIRMLHHKATSNNRSSGRES